MKHLYLQEMDALLLILLRENEDLFISTQNCHTLMEAKREFLKAIRAAQVKNQELLVVEEEELEI